MSFCYSPFTNMDTGGDAAAAPASGAAPAATSSHGAAPGFATQTNPTPGLFVFGAASVASNDFGAASSGAPTSSGASPSATPAVFVFGAAPAANPGLGEAGAPGPAAFGAPLSGTPALGVFGAATAANLGFETESPAAAIFGSPPYAARAVFVFGAAQAANPGLEGAGAPGAPTSGSPLRETPALGVFAAAQAANPGHEEASPSAPAFGPPPCPTPGMFLFGAPPVDNHIYYNPRLGEPPFVTHNTFGAPPFGPPGFGIVGAAPAATAGFWTAPTLVPGFGASPAAAPTMGAMGPVAPIFPFGAPLPSASTFPFGVPAPSAPIIPLGMPAPSAATLPFAMPAPGASTRPFVGLGGIDINGTQPNKPDGSNILDTPLPEEIVRSMFALRDYAEEQMKIRTELSCASASNPAHLRGGIHNLIAQLKTMSTSVGSNHEQVKQLRRETSKAIQALQVVQTTHNPIADARAQHSNTFEYLQCLVAHYEEDLQEFQREIALTEQFIHDLSNPRDTTPAAVIRCIRQLNEVFMVLAGRYNEVHQRVEELKKRYLSLRRDLLQDDRNVFELDANPPLVDLQALSRRGPEEDNQAEEQKNLDQNSAMRQDNTNTNHEEPRKSRDIGVGPSPFLYCSAFSYLDKFTDPDNKSDS